MDFIASLSVPNMLLLGVCAWCLWKRGSSLLLGSSSSGGSVSFQISLAASDGIYTGTVVLTEASNTATCDLCCKSKLGPITAGIWKQHDSVPLFLFVQNANIRSGMIVASNVMPLSADIADLLDILANPSNYEVRIYAADNTVYASGPLQVPS